MIKIIISGTYDGFYPRYATDGILDDDICKKLLDRRMYFSKAGDSLFKEGYSFQCVKDIGIFFHKIILLFDALGRDGFMMASLFLPVGEKLDGKEIKDALDSIIRDYKNRTSNGIATIDLDWSFVKRKADELVQKVKAAKWEKRPVNNSSATALISGVDNRVADYFDYPNPLHRVLSDYEQIFLTESLLDPSMISENGEQGYKVLKKEIVDIDNPEFTIVYENLLEGASISNQRETITKKELDSNPGGIPLGIYSKPGYRPVKVEITEKTRRDGSTLYLKLPVLTPKKATVELKIVDKITGEAISLEQEHCTIEWSNPHQETYKSNDTVYDFAGTSCDSCWHYIVKCDHYEVFSGDFKVIDQTNKSIEIKLIPHPTWTVFAKYDETTKPLHTNIQKEDLDYYVRSVKGYIEQKGWSIEKIDKNEDTHSVTVIGKKKSIYSVAPSDSKFQNNNESTSNLGLVPSKQDESSIICFLQLDKKSKNYSLFKKCREKNDKEVSLLAEDVNKFKSSLARLVINGQLGQKKYQTLVKQIDVIYKSLQAINKDEIKNALDSFDMSLTQCNLRTDIINIIKKTIIAIERNNAKIVSAPQYIKYNSKFHQLISERKEGLSEESIVLTGDNYNYFLDTPIWNENKESQEETIVKRVLSKKFRPLYWTLGSVASILILALVVVSFIGNGGKTKEILMQMSNLSTTIDNEYPNSYCGDSLYLIADDLNGKYTELASSKKELLIDSVYNAFYNILIRQSEYKEKDSQIFKEAMSLFDVALENFDLAKWDKLSQEFDVLTQEHQDTLKSKWEYRIKQIEERRKDDKLKAENSLYEQCMGTNGTIAKCDQFIQKYPNSIFLGDIKNKRQLLFDEWESGLYNACFNANATVVQCDKYLKYFKDPNNQRVKDVKARKQTLSSKAEPTQTNSLHTVKGSSDKTPINVPQALFNSLAWSNIKDGENAFFNKYDVVEKYVNRTKTLIQKAISAGKKKYEKTYKKVKNMKPSELNGNDRLFYLEKEL